MSLPDRILEVLGRNRGLKAADIALELGATKQKVNSLLYGKLSRRVWRDENYRWYLKASEGGAGKDPPAPVAADAEQVTAEPARSNPAVEQSAPVSVLSEGRIERVQAAVERWVAQLVDLTGRNRLLFYRKLKRGSLELTDASETVLTSLLDGRVIKLSQLLPDTADEPDRTDEAILNARTIYRKARSLFEERGIETLYIVVGIASWVTDATLATPASPLLMAPIRLKPVGSGETDYSVQVTGDWRINDTLLLYLAETYDTTIDASAILDVFDPSSRDRTEVYDRFRKETAQVPSITVRDRIGIGTFQYTKLPMVRDLVENVEELAANDIVAAIAGDESAREALREMRTDIDPAFPNEIAPADEFLVLDADSSQNYTITAVVGGESIVIQGPPGTGKSQTIANLIATLTARGRKVLFVAEKRAAIDAVTKRLRMVGLGDIVLDLHGGISSRRDLAAALATSLDRIKSVVAANDLDRDFRLVQNRKALLECSDSLHRVRDPFSVSVYDAYVGLAGLPDDLRLPVRLPSSQLNDLDATSAREARLALSEWAQLTAPLRDRSTAWVDTAITSADQASRAMEAAIAVSSVATTTATELATVLVETGLPAPATLEGWVRVFEVLGAIAALQEIADKSILRLSDDELSPLNAAMQPGLGSVVHRAWARLFDGPYRDAISTLREYWIGTKSASGARLADLVVRVMSVRAGWDEVRGSSEIRLPTALSTSETSAAELERRLAALGAFFVTRPESHLSHSDVGAWSSRLVAEQDILYRLPRVAELEQQLTASHLRPIVDAVANGEIRGEDVAAGFDYVWYNSIIAAATAVDPVLASFEGGLQTRRVEAFRNDDSEHVLTTPQRVERAIAMRAVEARNQHPGQDELIHAQARRKRGHLSLRELFRQAPDVLATLRPCWTMSPLLVAEVLPARQIFDVAIFDEASQILPPDAVSTLMRTKQVVVAGDDRQLPPTTFFDTADRSGEEDEEDRGIDLVAGYESILDVLGALLRANTLTWHYRSEDERLIAFSNHTMYGGLLTTFPGATTDQPLEFVLVPHRFGLEVDTRSSDAEVKTVVDLMIRHAREHPDETLGAIAMGIHHADRIDAALRQRLEEQRSEELDAFFADNREERAFVKNLERVQGDERDAIVLSIGYTKSADGQLRYRFGPLNYEGGERRLNVAVTRARRRVSLVAGFSHTDMDPNRSSARGVQLLRSYLKYAETGGLDLGDERQDVPLNAFELGILQRLERSGLNVIPQYGASGYRIDFAIVHPDRPGELLLAVEADGASYHSSPTARDRDRLRQEVLEKRGWRFHRIWSTDWFRNPDAEITKVLGAVEAAMKGDPLKSSSDDAPPEPTPSVPPTRGPRPPLGGGRSISDYGHSQLVALGQWILSDGLLRTDDELLEEMMRELDFRRRGDRIVTALQRAIVDVRRGTGERGRQLS